MNEAHGAGAGAGVEALVLAVALGGLGVIFFLQKATKPVISVALVLSGVVLGIGAVTVFIRDDHDEGLAPTPADGGYDAAVAALCQARVVARDDPAAASELFFAGVHDPLHDLATEVGERDRRVTAAVLEATAAVEETLGSSPVEGEALREDLSGLLDATMAALEELDLEVSAC